MATRRRCPLRNGLKSTEGGNHYIYIDKPRWRENMCVSMGTVLQGEWSWLHPTQLINPATGSAPSEPCPALATPGGGFSRGQRHGAAPAAPSPAAAGDALAPSLLSSAHRPLHGRAGPLLSAHGASRAVPATPPPCPGPAVTGHFSTRSPAPASVPLRSPVIRWPNRPSRGGRGLGPGPKACPTHEWRLFGAGTALAQSACASLDAARRPAALAH